VSRDTSRYAGTRKLARSVEPIVRPRQTPEIRGFRIHSTESATSTEATDSALPKLAKFRADPGLK
jgi:hypothetical protein